MNKKIRKQFSFVILIFFGLLFSCTSTQREAEMVFFNTDIADDASQGVLSRILEAGDKPISEIKFEKGIYHFYPEKALEQFCYISNHCDVMIRTAFPLEKLKNITIDGQGSTFIFHGIMIPFLVEGSQNVTIKNLSIDWADPFCSEGLVVANDLKKGTFDLEISDEYSYDIRNGQLFFIKEYYEHSIGQTIFYDPKTKAIAFQTEDYSPLTTAKSSTIQHNLNRINYKYPVDKRSPDLKYVGVENRLFVEELKPGLVRIYNHGKKIPPVGLILSSKGEQGFNRVAPAFRLSQTHGFTGENINIHHAGGMGIIAENSSDIILDNFNVTPSHGRMVSTTADATHFVGCRGKITIRNSTLENQLDDAMNVHGTYQIIDDILDDYRIGVRMGHHQQQGFRIGNSSDTLGLVRLSDSFFPYNKLTIKDIEYVNGRYQIVTLNEKLPGNVQKGDFIENLSAYPEVLVENCKIQNNRARGLLISTPKGTTVRNNIFHTEMEAILVPVESSFWYESGNGSNITITNNTFQDCVHSGQNRGIIRFETDDNNKNIAFHNIEISNNTFNHFDNWILEVSNADDLRFTYNTINNSRTFPPLFPESPVFKVESSKNIVFKNNIYNGNAKVILEKDESQPNLTFE